MIGAVHPEVVRLAPAPPAPILAPAPADPPPLRHDGWTPDRQVRFLAAIADGALVREACAEVGLTATAAYSFRRRAAGAAFALGWSAANLHARERLADRLLERALDGQVETITRPDGQVIERHRHDNRLAQAMLARLDRLAAGDPPAARAATTTPGHAAAAHPAADPHAAARTVAAGFEAYLDLIAADAGPARARLFVATASEAAGDPAPALALADRRLHAATLPDPTPPDPTPPDPTPTDPLAGDPFQPTSMTTSPATDATAADPAAPPPAPAHPLPAPPFQPTRTTTSPAAPDPTPAPPPPRDHHVLDPADRAGWTATDWARAEAGGLVRLAPPPGLAPDDADAPDTGPGTGGVPPLHPAVTRHLMRTEMGRAQLLAHALARFGDPPAAAGPAPAAETEADDEPPAVWRESADIWRTTFPPPPDFFGEEQAHYGDPDYERTLTADEQAIAERFEAAHPDRLAHAAARDAWFAGAGAPRSAEAKPLPDQDSPPCKGGAGGG